MSEQPDDVIFEPLTKVEVVLTAEAMSALYGNAAELGISRTDAMNQAVQLQEILLHLPLGQQVEIVLPGGEKRTFERLA